MPRYWVIAPFESKNQEMFDKVWQYDLANNVISIGWSELGDISKLNHEELVDAVSREYPDSPPATKSLFVNMLWAFYHDIKVGDIIIVRKGRKTLAAVGQVTRTAKFGQRNSPASSHRNFLDVAWNGMPRNKSFEDIVFPMHTLSELTEQKYAKLTTDTLPPPPLDGPDEDVEDQNAFVLEKYLEDFIVSNFDTIFRGQLRIYKDEDGEDGQQYIADDVGRIDILAHEPKSNSLVVIELKKAALLTRW
jgi:restriction system protein